jgi:coenzyme F420-dependent glucose-6-phosphate dehydrogenase
MSDDEFRSAYVISSDPQVHLERLSEVERMGATVICIQNGSGADPEGALQVYGEQVLPLLDKASV